MNTDYETKGFMKKNIIWVVLVGAAVVLGLLLWGGLDKVVNDTVDNMTTITGNFSCLPLKDGSNSAENCMLGVKSKDSSFYALDVSHIQDANTDLKAEDTIAVTGFLLPASEVDGTAWKIFSVAGVIKVNTLLRTR